MNSLGRYRQWLLRYSCRGADFAISHEACSEAVIKERARLTRANNHLFLRMLKSKPGVIRALNRNPFGYELDLRRTFADLYNTYNKLVMSVRGDILEVLKKNQVKGKLRELRFCRLARKKTALLILRQVFQFGRGIGHEFRTEKSPGDLGRIVIASGFPDYSFDKPHVAGDERVSQSFGEFLAREEFQGTSGDEVTLVDFDTYERLSRESGAAKEDYFKSLRGRHEPTHRIGVRSFKKIAWALRIIIWLFGVLIRNPGRTEAALLCLFWILICRSAPYIAWLREARRTRGRIDKIYILTSEWRRYPWTYEPVCAGRVRYFTYSHNFTMMPLTFSAGELRSRDYRCLEMFSMEIFSLGGEHVGFQRPIAEAIQFIESFFEPQGGHEMGRKVDCSHLKNEPVNLGYEFEWNPNDTPDLADSYLVLDVPPDTVQSQLRYLFAGGQFYSFTVNREFWTEIFDAAREAGVEILVKPKYALKNYSREYSELLAEAGRNRDNVRVLNPYMSTAAIMAKAAGVICMPNTSALPLARELNSRAVYYVPERVYFPLASQDTDVIQGSRALRNFFLR